MIQTRSVAAPFLTLFAFGCFKPPSEDCKSQTDCAAGFVCTSGKCIAVSVGGGQSGGTSTGGGASGGEGGGGQTGGGEMGGGDAGGGEVAGGSAGGDAGGTAGGMTLGGGTAGGMTLGGGTAGGMTVGGGTAGGMTVGGGSADGGMLVRGDTCANAIPVNIADAGVALMGTTIGATPNYRGITASECKLAEGADVVYLLSIPAATRLNVTATPLSRFDLAVNVVGELAACTSTPLTGCLAAKDLGGEGEAETLAITNAGPARSVYLMMDGWRPQDLGNFLLTIMPEPILAGDACEAPAVLTPGAPLMAQTLSGFSDDYSGASGRCRFRSDVDRVYSVTVPAGQQLTATVSPVGFDASLSLIRAPASNCAASMCEASVDLGFSNTDETLRWNNVTGTAQPVFLLVDSSNSTGTFSISASLTPSPPVVTGGATCSTATELDAGTYVSTTLGRTSNYDFFRAAGCMSSSPAPDTTFRITVPPNSALIATVNPDDWDAVVNAMTAPAACGIATDAGTMGAACLASSDGISPRAPERINYRNTSSVETPIYLVVDGAGSSAAGPFTITSEVTPLANFVGDSCSAPQALMSSGSLTGLSTGNYVDDVRAPSCFGGGAPGPDRIFSITVPPNKQLTAVAIPTGGWDLAISIILPTECGMNAMCLARSDASVSGSESAQYLNASAMPINVLIVVDSYSESQFGTFDLFTAFAP